MVMDCVIQFSVISTLIYINTFCSFQVGECRQLFFPAKFMFGDRRLTKHTIATIKVVDFDFCEMQCYNQLNCVSINFKVLPDSEGLHECELNNATHQSHDNDLQNKKGYVYKGAESTCDRAVCENGGTCQSGFTDKGYHCVCPPGFTSAHCEQDVDECSQEPDLCSAKAVCRNIKGSYNCYCEEGYTGDGRNCTLLRESTDSFKDCQEGWVEHNHSCYRMISIGRYYRVKFARQRCNDMSADLPIIKSQSENDFIHSLMKMQNARYVGLGMERNNSGFFWFDGSPAEPSQGAMYSAWMDYELEAGTGVPKKCAYLEFITKKWRVYYCSYWDNTYVLCQRGMHDQEGP
ncbi:PREDICTED: neurogenic locus notch homolog protein 1-like [Acropora digitifera]|uniref:neurogenic locus notch homolog protein 1-like n=1 Tax=Acropora digitifera TaxID=70779 RepID=UPI00077A5946|nr:PREDICTED: neurogenic locus notch homolog protein 1-like [Acropora digitifera]